MKRLLQNYWGDSSGQFAIMTAILTLPLTVCIGIAIDTAYVHNKATGLQTALDSAALASVVPGNLTNEERADFAKQVFSQNYDPEIPVEIKVHATESRVDIQGTIEKETLFLGLAGSNKITQSNKSAAIKTIEDVICIMTLDKEARGSLRFEKNAIVNTPGCSIQVNSSDQNALIAAGNYQPNAKRICVHGGVNGNAGPNVQANCTALDDPYANLEIPKFSGSYEDCNYGPIDNIADSAIDALFQYLFFGSVDQTTIDEVMEVLETTFAISYDPMSEIRYPGVYCHGLHFYDAETTLMPGTYYIQDGPLSFGGGAKVTGDGVTFVFRGDNSYLYTYDDVFLDLTAPRSGKYAGLLFAQDKNSSDTLTSIIKGNADIRLVGTSYFPTQDLFIGGLGTMGASSPAMAFIAENIVFTSDIEDVISSNEKDFQYFKQAMLEGVNFVHQLGLTDYSVDLNAIASRSGTSIQNFTTTILTNLGTEVQTGLPMPKTDGGARLVSTDNSPF